jgi:hypothetical protein
VYLLTRKQNKQKERYKMNVTQNIHGAWVVSDIINGQFVERRYMGYSKQEAVDLFLDFFRVEEMGLPEALIDLQRDIRNNGGLTVSEATMRTADLINSFIYYVDACLPEAAAALREEYSGVFDYMDGDGANDAWFHEADEDTADSAGWLLDGLFDAMNEIAPEGYGFSSQEGDGACYGFWKDERIAEAEWLIDQGEFTPQAMLDLILEFDGDVTGIIQAMEESLRALANSDYDIAEQITQAAR